MKDVVQDALKFTKARFESVHADRPENSSARRRLREQWRSELLPPALIPEGWRVAEDFCYWTNGEGKGDAYIVPKGYRFDGASVPWPLTVLVPKTHPIYLGAAALHDYLYERRHEDVERKKADDLFLDALLLSGLNWIWAGLMWRAVRSAGWAVWYKRKDETTLGKVLNARGPVAWLAKVITIGVGTTVRGISGILADVVTFANFVRARQTAIVDNALAADQ